ncbi:glycosyltransferase [Vitreimonas sp.]|uniref:glycosyltransferase n=1 Tax=Vitreimonas sp. TaxID=3069702 RepID=UPI002EDB51E3
MGGMTADHHSTYIIVDVATRATATIRDHRLQRFTERHEFSIDAPDFVIGQDVERLAAQAGVGGIIFSLDRGAPGLTLLRKCGRLLRAGERVYFYWPEERALEVLDRERLASFWRLWFVTRVYGRWHARREARKAQFDSAALHPTAGGVSTGVAAPATSELAAHLDRIIGEASSLKVHNEGAVATLRDLSRRYAEDGQEVAGREMWGVADYVEAGLPVLDRVQQFATAAADALGAATSLHALPPPPPQRTLPVQTAMEDVRALIAMAQPAEFRLEKAPNPRVPLTRPGMYARLDFWAPLTSGGSYGHTVYQAKALSRTTQDFACVVANPFRTLDKLGVRQVVVQPERREGNETNIVDANRFYYERLKPVIEAMRPAFIFERLVLGSYVIAKICRELGIPYIAEYNGSEISMMRSFSGQGYDNEDFYLAAEEFAFKQATLISVVSEHVGADVAKRGVPRRRILTNPNAVELDAYAPAPTEERRAIRAELGFGDSDRVIGFIGTFGGWHGVDVLAGSMHKILARAPNARFLLIGDGNLKPMVLEAIEKHRLHERVKDVGRVPQTEGARLLKACDVLVSPHSSHMVDSKFFGSPTKLFEYMAMAAGIVASDLEQIGEVLAPALRLEDLRSGRTEAGQNRALLCAPGNEDEFVEAVLALVNNPALSAALGKNARQAAERYYTWDQHVADLWAVLSGTERHGFHADLATKGIE